LKLCSYAVMQLCPVPRLRNEDARHVLRDGTVFKLYKLHDPAEAGLRLRQLADPQLA
jgi:hypothetical protein